MRLERLGVLLLALFLWGGISTRASAAEPGDRLLPLEVTVNGANLGTWVFVERGGALFAPKDAIDEWRVQLKPGLVPVVINDVPHIPLALIPGYRAKVDYAAQSLTLSFSEQAFAATRIGEEAAIARETSPAMFAGFVNYDLSAQVNNARGAPGIRTFGLLSEVGLSTPYGVLTSGVAARSTNLPDPPPGSSGVQRLETTFARDFPESKLSLRVGDSSTQPGIMGRYVYFGGLKIGTNFGLIPGFNTQPVPTLAGATAAPSTVELYINDVLRQVSNVPTGPFTVANIPQFSGAGDVRLVVRDVLGRETVLVQPFFQSPQLLAPGLMDWSFEAGAVRQDLGIESNQYGPGFAALTARRGFTNEQTFELRTEYSKRHQALGLGLITVLPGSMLGQFAVMASRHDQHGQGFKWQVAADRSTTGSSIGLQVEGASRGFRQLGIDEGTSPIKLQAFGNASMSLQRFGTLGAGFAVQERHDGTRITTISANYSLRVLERGVLALTLGKAIGGSSGTNAAVTLTLPIDKQIITSSSVSYHQGQLDFYSSAARSSGEPESISWRALAGRYAGVARTEAGLFYDGHKMAVTADASAGGQGNALRVSAAGGLAVIGGNAYVTRRVNDSFALVEVPGYGGVGVSVGSQYLGRTDERGYAFVPRLIPYQRNTIRLNPQDLPVSAEIDNIELETIPPYRSGVLVRFPVRLGRGAVLRIVMENGDVAPAGAVLRLGGDGQEFYVARRGEAFVTGMQDKNVLTLVTEGGSCTFTVELPPMTSDEIPKLGPFVCRRLKP